MSYICPTCNKSIKTKHGFERHIERCDAKEPAAGAGSETEDLNLVPPAGNDAEVRYHCVECGHEPITKGQETCPGCGITFDWSAVNEGN